MWEKSYIMSIPAALLAANGWILCNKIYNKYYYISINYNLIIIIQTKKTLLLISERRCGK